VSNYLVAYVSQLHRSMISRKKKKGNTLSQKKRRKMKKLGALGFYRCFILFLVGFFLQFDACSFLYYDNVMRVKNEELLFFFYSFLCQIQDINDE
jgi:hypothetical protein